MKNVFQNPRLKKLALNARPFAIFVGIFLLLKVTGAGSGISYFTQSALMKTGAMDVEPEVLIRNGDTFNYDFSLKDLDGKKIHMSELKGKVIFLNLWATWCGPCRVEMPSIQNLYNSVDKDKIAFVMLSLDQEDQQGKITQYIKGKGFTFPVYVPASPLPKLLRVNSIPATFIIGPDGKVASKKIGMANYDTAEMREFLKDLAAS
jgi:thiol-disulfide isomerase/thioredoxin